ncbi:hypothetical protein HYU23_03005 [Candidatus Woesearchaeota archaeon]|nr:hypothetical protein [Candidatus Woesearchaeota archaeon]
MVKSKNKNGLFDNSWFWIIIIILAVTVFVASLVYWIKFAGEAYDGRNGEYKITSSKVGNTIFYHVSVDVNNNEYIYSFRNHPVDLEDIYLEPGLLAKLNRPDGLKIAYITQDIELANMTDSDSVLAIAAFEQILTGNFGIYNVPLINTYTENFVKSKRPINCTNVSDNVAVIYLRVGDETRVYSENDCIIIQGRGGNGLVRAAEKFAYYLIGVF